MHSKLTCSADTDMIQLIMLTMCLSGSSVDVIQWGTQRRHYTQSPNLFHVIQSVVLMVHSPLSAPPLHRPDPY